MKYYLLLPLLLLRFSTKAQIQFNSFQEVMNFADAHAFSIKNAQISEQISITEKKEAKSNLVPSLTASLGYNDNITIQPTLVPARMFNPSAEEGAVEELTFGTRYTYTRGLQAQWDVLNFQKLFAIKTADLKIKESKVNTDLNRYNTYNQLASTYYSILLTQESIKIYEENVEVSTSIFQLAVDKFQNGIISEAELNRSEIRNRQNLSNLNQAQNNLAQFYLQLQSQLNTNQIITVLDSPEQFTLENTNISNQHPEVLLNEIALEKQQSILKQTKALRLPSLSLIYQNNQNWATDRFWDLANANTLPQQTFGIKFSWSGFTNFSTKQKIKQSEWQLEMQQQQLEHSLLVKQQEDQLLQLQWDLSADQLIENKEILALQEKNDGYVEDQYEAGIISLDARLDKYDDLLTAQDRYLQSLASFTLAQYKIYIRQIDFSTSE